MEPISNAHLSYLVVRELRLLIAKADKARVEWTAFVDTHVSDPSELDRLKFQIILVDSELLGYIKGALG
jgi:hypothetical protein